MFTETRLIDGKNRNSVPYKRGYYPVEQDALFQYATEEISDPKLREALGSVLDQSWSNIEDLFTIGGTLRGNGELIIGNIADHLRSAGVEEDLELFRHAIFNKDEFVPHVTGYQKRHRNRWTVIIPGFAEVINGSNYFLSHRNVPINSGGCLFVVNDGLKVMVNKLYTEKEIPKLVAPHTIVRSVLATLAG